MRIHLEFDHKVMRAYHDRGSTPLIGVWWSLGEVSYPAQGWTDFATVVLWWTGQVERMCEGATDVEMLFMDGPQVITATRCGELVTLRARGVGDVWHVPLWSLAHELHVAGKRVLSALVEAGCWGLEADAMSVSVERLGRTIERHAGTR